MSIYPFSLFPVHNEKLNYIIFNIEDTGELQLAICRYLQILN